MPADAGPRRAELLQVAREVFSERGFERTGVRDIAARMDLLAGSLYYYIDSKQALLGEVLTELQAPSGGLLEDARSGAGTVPERLSRLLRDHTAAVAEDPIGVTLVFTEAKHLDDATRAQVVDGLRGYRRTLEALLREGQAEGTIRAALDPGLAAMGLLGIVNWTSRWLRPDGPVPVGVVGEQLATLGLHGFAADGAAFAAPGPEADPVDPEPGSRREDVMRAAARLYTRAGFESTSMADLGAELGMSKAALYHHFPKKEQLLFTIAAETQAVGAARVEAIAAGDGPALDRLAAALHSHVRYLAARLDSTSLVLHAWRSLTPEHRDHMRALDRAYSGVFRTLVEQAQAQGTGRAGLDPAVATRGVLGGVNWLYRWYRPDGPRSAADIAAELVDVLLRGVVTR